MTARRGEGGACEQTMAQLAAYLDGDLDGSACAIIERHCGSCAECARLVSGLRDTMGMCRDAGHHPLPDDVRRRARQRIDEIVAAGPLMSPTD
jgi:anti-sigma factor RsiW